MKKPIILTIILFTVQFLAPISAQTEQKPRLVVQNTIAKKLLLYFPKMGTLLAIADDDTATVLDINSGREIRTFFNNTNFKLKQDSSPLALAFSPDGNLLATFNGGDGTLRIWDIISGSLSRKIEAGENSYYGGEEYFFRMTRNV